MDSNRLDRLRRCRLLIVALSGTCACLSQNVSLGLSSGSVIDGSNLNLNLVLTADPSDPPASLEWTVRYPLVNFSGAVVSAGTGNGVPGKTLSCAPASGVISCILWGLNNSTISNGVVATVQLTASASPFNGFTAVHINGITASDAQGVELTTITATAGRVRLIPNLNGLSCDAVTLAVAAVANCTISLSTGAPYNGSDIALSASPGLLVTPNVINIPRGSTSLTFTAVAAAVSNPTVVTLTASYAGMQETFQITINPLLATKEAGPPGSSAMFEAPDFFNAPRNVFSLPSTPLRGGMERPSSPEHPVGPHLIPFINMKPLESRARSAGLPPVDNLAGGVIHRLGLVETLSSPEISLA